MGRELGATLREQAPFPAVWFTGMERPGGWMPWRECPCFQRSEGRRGPGPRHPGCPDGMRTNGPQVHVCLTGLSQSSAWGGQLAPRVSSWPDGNDGSQAPGQAWVTSTVVGGLPVLWIKTGCSGLEFLQSD